MSECICPDALSPENEDARRKQIEDLSARLRKAIDEGDKLEGQIVLLELQLLKAQDVEDDAAASKIQAVLEQLRYQQKLIKEQPELAEEIRENIRSGKATTLPEGLKQAIQGKPGGAGKKGEKGVDAKKGPPSKIKKDCCGKAGRPAR